MGQPNVVMGRDVSVLRLSVLLSALRLECMGMRRNGPSAFSIVKREFRLHGSRKLILAQFEAIVAQAKSQYETANQVA